MPSMRRIKTLGLLLMITVVTILYFTSSSRKHGGLDSPTSGDFYVKTKKALNNRDTGTAGSKKTTEDEEVSRKMQERLKEAAQVAKDNANAKAPKPDPPSSLVGVGSSAEGAREDRGVSGRKKPAGEAQAPIRESNVDHDVEAELNSILKKSPIIIFSKSYCPHSRRAKAILLDKYIIDPAPFVVELDQHPLGLNLQDRLEELTTRRTVPNVLINGVSIGGGDDIAALDSAQTLIGKINSLGGKRMFDVRLRPLVREPAGDEKVTEGHGLR